MMKRNNRNQLVETTFDFAAARPDGFKLHELADHLEVSERTAKLVIRLLRVQLGDDSINLTATPAGAQQPWTYRLVGTYAEAQPWQMNRIADTETRLETIESVSASVARGADKRTKEGKKALLIHKVVSRLREDLVEIEFEHV